MTEGELTIVRWIQEEFEGYTSVLDVGSMTGKYLAVVKAPRRIALDAHKPYLDDIPFECDKIAGDACDWLARMRTGSIEGIMALDFIEHLEKDDGSVIIGHMQRVATKKVLLFTPNGFMRQDPTTHPDLADPTAWPWQTHRSGWTHEELRRYGFDTKPWGYSWRGYSPGGIMAVFTKQEKE